LIGLSEESFVHGIVKLKCRVRIVTIAAAYWPQRFTSDQKKVPLREEGAVWGGSRLEYFSVIALGGEGELSRLQISRVDIDG
jgi:hypothetical protein